MKHGFAAAVFVFLMTGCVAPKLRPYLDAARETGTWIESVGVETAAGRAWPSDPAAPASMATDLYHGSSGVVLFFLGLYDATGERVWLAAARAGADELLATLPDSLARPDQAGLYTGVAGVGFVLGEVHRATGDPSYRDGAVHCVDLLADTALNVGAGVEWGPVTDVISGTAGIGLFLLHAAEELDHDGALDLASAAGRRLLELGGETDAGTSWPMSPDYPRRLPNFSHGTAGVAYFLAKLFDATEELPFLDAALAGARHVRALTGENGLVYHHTPEGEELFYLGWCHGPAGTGRLYIELWELTEREEWRTAAEVAADGLLASGIPGVRPEGFWNNVSPCCGSAGIGEFLLDLHGKTDRSEYLALARALTDDLLARSVDEDGGRRWVQCEHRVRPELLQAQTGYMQGAAGVGLWLLRLDALDRRRTRPRAVPGS